MRVFGRQEDKQKKNQPTYHPGTHPARVRGLGSGETTPQGNSGTHSPGGARPRLPPPLRRSSSWVEARSRSRLSLVHSCSLWRSQVANIPGKQLCPWNRTC